MDLNAEQRRAVEAVRGPVCILAGAGSGKTTTITHRIANQVASGAFAPSQILAVTFTDKAAGEMRGRLEGLGVTGVRASTFHSAALSQLRYFRPEAVGKDPLLESTARLQHRPRAAAAVQVPRGRRLRHRDRVGAQPAHPAVALPRLDRRPPAARARRRDAARLRALRAGQARAGADRLRGSARARDRGVRGRARLRGVPRALPRVHGRRVPGRQPAPADAARRVARRARRSLRRR